MTGEPTRDAGELMAAVVQDVENARVLMLGWMNQDALDRTRESGRVTFWSRSRGELWEKGETSGNWLELVSIDADCDGDALLVKAIPHGPTCHTGSTTCWGEQPAAGFAGLDHLWEVISDRARRRPEGSYTTHLLEAGPEGPGRKLVEESTEVLLAAKDHASGTAGDRRVAEEAADLLYHLLVILAERDISPTQVLSVLADRRHP
ncbi:MAG: bifunctional phosphoribosyl-AMP cyclohydrolase/phosphoribosyl-ATP diphosphatase HisIE [Actinomycetota bacterium]